MTVSPLAKPLPSAGRIRTDIAAEVAGVQPFYLVALLEYIPRTAVIGANAVYSVHPARQLAAVKFINIIYAFYIGAVVNGGVYKLKVNFIFLHLADKEIKHTFTLIKGNGCFRKYNSVFRNKLKLVLVKPRNIFKYIGAAY